MATKIIFSEVWENMSLKHFLFRYIRTTILFLGAMGVLIFSNNALAQNPPQTFNSSGTFTVPHKITTVQVQVWGAGGGGGFNPTNNRPAAGGGGGGFSQTNSYAVTPSSSINYSVGGGGLGGSSSGISTDGGNSTFGVMTSNGGVRGDVLIGGTGGTSSGGTQNFTGGNSPNASNLNNNGGSGGGGGAGPGGNGGPGGSNSVGTGGSGGTSPSGGIGGAGGNSNLVGGNGTAPGGGGGGEGGNGSQGGNGGNGQIIISWTCSNMLNSAAGTDNQTVCQGTGITNITYEIAGAYGATFSGLPAGVTGTYNLGDVTISGTPTTPGTYNYTITPTGSCTSTTATGTITVTPNNTVLAPSNTPTLCINTALTNITHTTTGATGIGSATGLPAGVTAVWASNAITISGTPTASGTFNYSIPLTGGCGTVNAIGTITVTPDKTVSTPSSSPTLCINTALTNITHTTTGATGIGVATGLPAGVTAVWASNAITISGTPTASGTFNYSIPLTGGCGTANATGTITVTPDNTVSVPSSTPTFCINTGLTNITHTTIGATGIGAATGLPAGVTAVWASNTITISGTPTASGIFNYSIPLTGGCGVVNATGIITVTPDNTASVPSSTPTICINSALTNITHTTTGATGIGLATGLPAGVNSVWASNTITISGTPTASGIFNYSIPLTGGCGVVNATGTITVTPDNTVSAPSSTPTLCVNTPLTNITHSTTGATGISNAGMSGANGLPAGLSAIWSGNVITISGTPTQAGIFNYSIPLIGGCLTLFAEGTITINPATSIASESLAAQTICDGQNFTSISITATGTGTLTYQWYSNTTNNNTTGTTIAGATSSSYTPPSSSIGTEYYYVVVSSNCGASVASNVSGAFTVDPITSIAAHPNTSTQVECFGDGFSPISVSAIGGGLTYQWYKNTANSNSGGVAVPGANSASFTPPSNSQGSAYYYAVVTGNCGTETSDVSGEFIVTPPVTTISQDPSTTPQTVCLGDTFSSLIVGAIGEGTVTYQWYRNTSSTNSGGILITGETNPSFTPPATTVGTTYYYATASSNCGTVPTDVSGVFTVTPDMTVSAPSTISPVCINIGLTTITHTTTGATGIGVATGLPTGITAAWSANTITISGTPTQSGSFTYSIPLVGGCGAASASGTINVTPDMTVSGPSTVSPVCINTALTSFTHTTTGAIGIGAATGLPAGVSASWAGNTITISGTPTASGTFNYSIPLTGGCGTVNATGTFSVTPDNTVTAAPIISPVCINTTLTSFTHTTTGATGIGAATGLPAGVSATWAGNTITISGTPTASGTFNYSIPLTGGCGTVNATGTFAVTPDNTVTAAPVISPVCINTALTSFTHTTTGATGIGAATGLPAGVSATWAGNTITISGTPTASGTFNYSIPLTGGCGTVNATGTFAVTPDNTVTAAPIISPVCISTALTSFTHTTTGATGIGAATGLPAGVSATWAGNTITISGTPTASGTFNYSIPLTGGCGTVNATGTITVTPNNTVSAPSSTPTLCINTPLTNITHSTTGATGIGAATGLPAGVSATWAGNTITISGTPTASGTFNYSIPLTGGCGTVNATGSIIVRPNNTVSAPSSTPTRCINTSLTAITHTTTGATGIGAATGLPAGVTASWSANTITISGTPTVSGTFNYSIPLTGGCGTAVATGTITVRPNNTVSAPSSTPTLCINTALTPITYTTTGATGIGAATGLPAGITASWAGNTITISGTPTASGTFNYSIPLTGGCGTVNATGTITVTPNNTVSAPSSTPTLCINTTLTAITHSTTRATGIGVATGLPVGVSATWAGNTITISGTPTASGTFNYSIPLTGGCGTVNATGTITVTPNNTVSAPSSTPTLCINTPLTNITHSTTGATGIGAATGLPAGVTASWAGNTITISGTPTASGTFNYSIPLTGGCGTVNATGTITVTPNNTVSAPSSTPTLCINTTLTAITHSTTGATGIGSATGLPAGVTASWTGNTITISGTPTASGTFNYSIPLSGGCLATPVNATGTISVNPATTITSESLAAQTICDGQNFTSISITATGTGTLTYQWYTNTTNNNTTGTTIAGATSSSYTPPSSPIGTNYYYVIVSSNCGPSITSTISGAFTVNPITAITSQPSTANQLECFGDGFNPITVSANGANLTYQWYRNSTSSNSGGISIPGANSASFTPPSNSQGTAFYYAVVTGNCGVRTSDVSGEFTVTAPATTVTLNPSTTPQIICLGDSFNSISVNAIGEGTVNYQWYSNSSASNSGGTIIPGAISTAYTPLSGTVGTTYYYAVANSDCGTVPTAVSGAFTVNPLTSIDSEILTGATICEGNGPFSPISVNASGTGTLNYQWYSNTTNSNSGGSVISGANTNSFTPPSNVVGPAPVYYYVEVSSTGGCGPSKISTVSGAFIVNPNNTATAASTSPTVCINTVLPNITHSTANATGISNSGVSGANGLPTGVSATWTSNTITISGTPTASGTFNYSIPLAGGCGTVAATGTITVNPVATVSPPSVVYPSVCISSPALAPFTQSTTGVTGIGVPTGLPPGITATFNTTTKNIDFSGTVTGTATGLYSYTIPLTGNCINGLQATGTIDVTPNYVLTSVSSVSATSIGGTATITINGDPSILSNGTYEVKYQIAQGSGSFVNVGPVTVTVTNGRGSFSTIPINSVDDTYVVQILSIKKSTDICTITLPDPPSTYFGVCSAVFQADGTFYVPANVFSITIEVYGGGGAGGPGGAGGGAYSIRRDIPVTPGEPIGIFVGPGGQNSGTNGEVTYVTRDSNTADQLGNSLVYANGGNGGSLGTGGTFDPRFSGANGSNANGNNGGDGGGPLGGDGGLNKIDGKSPGGGGGAWSGGKGVGGNGLVVISYSCPDADDTDCIKIIDDGAKSGYTVIEYTCDDVWTAPEGLAEFTVFVGSGGGGGGGGEGSGGGGSGSLIGQTLTTSNPYGFPAATNFTIDVGEGGPGAVAIDLPGSNGEASTFTGSIDGNAINITVPGGGGGGSSQQNPGGNGASGGGGGASPNPAKSEGFGGTPNPITYAGPSVIVYQGNAGGDGDYSEPQNSVAGGGGGGLIPWKPLPANDGQNGKAAGEGQGEGGRGGDGIVLTLGDSIRYYGAGGGGIGRYFNGTDKIGLGGSAGGVKIGGDGNLTVPSPIGYPGMDKTGSGGGAGYNGGGKGGKGVVYIVYYNVRILGVEYQSFTATYNSQNRSGELKWATTKEWENSHFEVERAVNDTRNWTKVGEVTGQGYSDVPVEYSFTDLNLPASGGNIFYRLRQVDWDGDFSFSLTRAIQVEALEGSTSWIAYPNPSAMRSSITVDLLDRSGYTDESILIRISDARGIFESYSVSGPEEVSAVVNSYLDESRPGLHIIQLIWGRKSEQLKLIRK